MSKRHDQESGCFFGKIEPFDASTGRKYPLDLYLDTFTNRRAFDIRPAVGIAFVQVFLKAEVIPIAVSSQVIAGFSQSASKTASDIANIRIRFGHRQPQLWNRSLVPRVMPPFDSKKIAVATLRCNRSLRMGSMASTSKRVAWESLPQMSVVTAA